MARIKGKTKFTISSIHFGILRDEFYINIENEDQLTEVKSLIKDKFIEIIDEDVKEVKKSRVSKEPTGPIDPTDINNELGSKVTISIGDGEIQSKMVRDATQAEESQLEDAPAPQKPAEEVQKPKSQKKKEIVKEEKPEEEADKMGTEVVVATGRRKTQKSKMQNNVVKDNPIEIKPDSPFIDAPAPEDKKDDDDDINDKEDVFIDI